MSIKRASKAVGRLLHSAVERRGGGGGTERKKKNTFVCRRERRDGEKAGSKRPFDG